jgi:hypothetical protein
VARLLLGTMIGNGIRVYTLAKRNLSTEAILAREATRAVDASLLRQTHSDDIFDQKLAGYVLSYCLMRKLPKELEPGF